MIKGKFRANDCDSFCNLIASWKKQRRGELKCKRSQMCDKTPSSLSRSPSPSVTKDPLTSLARDLNLGKGVRLSFTFCQMFSPNVTSLLPRTLVCRFQIKMFQEIYSHFVSSIVHFSPATCYITFATALSSMDFSFTSMKNELNTNICHQ